MRSDHWKKVSEQRKELDGGKCQNCGKMKNLECHHLTYKNIGHENIEYDLITLCHDCHSEFHNLAAEAIGKIQIMVSCSELKISECKKKLEAEADTFINITASECFSDMLRRRKKTNYRSPNGLFLNQAFINYVTEKSEAIKNGVFHCN